jgi:hypothetical protein
MLGLSSAGRIGCYRSSYKRIPVEGYSLGTSGKCATKELSFSSSTKESCFGSGNLADLIMLASNVVVF